MIELVEMIAKALVDHPDEVEAAVVEEDDATVIELTVSRDDLGQVIGKNGRTARAMRMILGACGAKLDKNFELEILE